MKNLVLGFATNQPPAAFATFVNSLRKVYTADQCDVVLIVDSPPDGPALDANYVSTRNVYPHRHVIARRSKSLFIRLASSAASASKSLSSGPARAILDEAMERWHHPHYARWLAYRRFLRDHSEYEQILLTDVRDVLFQGEFFLPDVKSVQLFEQDEFYGTGNCDSDWYQHAWGTDALNRISSRPAICIGTILGPRDQILMLIDDFIAYFSPAPFRGVEQAIFNRMLFDGDLRFDYVVNHNVEGLVATLSNLEAIDQIVSSAGLIRTAAGKIIPVVHMYDRVDALAPIASSYAHQ
ncbi:hypothetical protein Q5H91_00860 [Sphingomonas sp. KR1UV-12]|uniref:Glycosyltransferase family 2 protein n=1 Tax=Sphingomonas aurea TaxID=3063994 RepID=A0ABT9EFK8_9SPHN|nr:hypothetical protein [Sphingomonas sp. KR1UV-12]MDP1025752.1 hypothetical protein [Sphingomonas sp. KR1UV-12]